MLENITKKLNDRMLHFKYNGGIKRKSKIWENKDNMKRDHKAKN